MSDRPSKPPAPDGPKRDQLGAALLELTQDGVWAMNARHETIYVNDRLAELLGRRAPELLGRPVESFMFEEDLPAHRERMELRHAGRSGAYEHRFRGSDGGEVWMRVAATALRAPDGSFAGSVALLTDITEARRNTEALRVMVEMLDHAPASITVHDFEGRFLYANEMTFQLHGLSREEFLARRLSEIDVPETAALIEERMRRIRERGTATFEVRHRRGDGGEFPLEVFAKQVSWAGRPALLSVATDLSERRQSAEALRAKSEEIDRYFESSLDLICIADVDGYFRRLNPAWEQVLGYPLAELEGRRFLEFVHPEDLPATLERVAQLERQEAVLSFENRYRRRDGSCCWIEWRSLPRGRTIYASARDITARKQAEEEHRRLEHQLREAQKMEAVGRLAGGLAHDFNNILTAIQSYAGVAVERLADDDPLRDDLEQIRHAGRRATELTRQLLAFSRRQLLAPVTLDLNRLVADVERLLRRLLGEDVELVLELAPEVGAVRADPGQLEQVLMNLAVNARDAMPEGGRLVLATADASLDFRLPPSLAHLPAGPYVRLSVTDTGCGMSEDTLSHLFEPFFTTKAPGQGTGLGLPTVYGIVTQSGGGLAVRSAVGRGTTIEVYLPRADDEPRGAPARAAEPVEPAGGTETVLVAEDDDQVRGLAVRILRLAGYRVLAAADGEQALTVAARHPEPIHLLLTDVVMPGLGGRQLAQRLVALRPALRVVFMSGYADDAAFREQAGDADVPFVPKPFDPLQLRAKVREALDARR